MSLVSPNAGFGPVRLRYNAALRGVKPCKAGDSFTYAQMNPSDIPAFLGLAASNPEGLFFGLLEDDSDVAPAQRQADERRVLNVSFIAGTPSRLLEQAGKSATRLPMLDFLCADLERPALPAPEREALFALAAKRLRPGGLLALRYRAYAQPEDNLRFLVNELGPDMDVDQAKEFLEELRALSPSFFAHRPSLQKALLDALESGVPDSFFAACGQGEEASSGTFDTMAALLPLGFAFAGDATTRANYMELSTPASAHPVLENCRQHLLYEPVKDFAMQRLERTDIWCRMPAETSDNVADLFGEFTYGLAIARDKVPSTLDVNGVAVPLDAPPYRAILDLMALMPVRIGDILEHPSGAGLEALDVLGAVQVLVALDLARPMRSSYEGQNKADPDHPRWATDYNAFFDTMPITSAQVVLASPVVGEALLVSARDALVLQALHRKGMADSVEALLPELLRIANDPLLSSTITDSASPSVEVALSMINDVVNRSLVRWYSWGVMAA